MYILRGHWGRRGFSLSKDGQTVFKTRHRFGLFPSSFVTFHGFVIDIKPENTLGDKWTVFKDGNNIGRLDFSHYRYAVIALSRTDGGEDVFKLEESGYSQVHTLSDASGLICKFTTSLNPLRFDDKYDVDIISTKFPNDVLEELLLYAGEVLYRMVRPDQSPL